MSCFDYAVHYLARYPKTTKELSFQLRKKGFEEESIHDTIQKLHQKKILNDPLFAELYIISEVMKKGKPIAFVRQKLRQKGIEKDILDEIEERFEEEISIGMDQKITKEIIRLRNKKNDDRTIMTKLISKCYPATTVRHMLGAIDSNDF